MSPFHVFWVAQNTYKKIKHIKQYIIKPRNDNMQFSLIYPYYTCIYPNEANVM